MNIGQQRDFYRLKELSVEDIKFLEAFCSKQEPALRDMNMRWVAQFNRMFEFKRKSLEAGGDADKLEPVIRDLSIRLEEHLHFGIEDRASPYMAAMLNGDVSFYANSIDRGVFLHYLCVQYTRTRKLKMQALEGPKRITATNPEAMWNVLCHIMANSLGASMLREQYELYLLHNHTGVSLITGDQPVINIHASYLPEGQMVDELEFYYPLSPTLALLVALSPPDDSEMTVEDVAGFNRQMVRQSHEQVYAASSSDLEVFRTGRWEPLP
jgi:hypothetical protein